MVALFLLLTLEVPVRMGGWYTGVTGFEEPLALSRLPAGEVTGMSSGVAPTGKGGARTPMPRCGDPSSGVDTSAVGTIIPPEAERAIGTGGRAECGPEENFARADAKVEELAWAAVLPKCRVLPTIAGTFPALKVEGAAFMAALASLPAIRCSFRSFSRTPAAASSNASR